MLPIITRSKELGKGRTELARRANREDRNPRPLGYPDMNPTIGARPLGPAVSPVAEQTTENR